MIVATKRVKCRYLRQDHPVDEGGPVPTSKSTRILEVTDEQHYEFHDVMNYMPKDEKNFAVHM